MKIALCNGGLGNQTFQYIFARWMELHTGELCWLDDRAFFGEKTQHNGFELTKVFPNARPHLLSTMFDKEVWESILQADMSVVQQLKDAGNDFTVVAETSDYQYNGNIVHVEPRQYSPNLRFSKGNLYFHGYWIHRDWLKGEKACYDVFRKELQFAELTEVHNLEYARQIRETVSVSIHIRRGDFVELGWDSAPEEYKQVIMRLENSNAGGVLHYFVFSDDLSWCRSHMEELGLLAVKDRVVFVQGNSGEKSFRDMQLMAMCKGNIVIGNSSFSYLAALLNVNEEPFYVNFSKRKL